MTYNKLFYLLIFLAYSLANAVVMSESPSLQKIIETSSDIVIAKVIEKNTYLEKHRVFSIYTFKVLEDVSGFLKPNDSFQLRLFGGKHGSNISYTSGMTHFKRNEIALLFLKQRNGYLYLSAGSFSKIHVIKEGSYYSLNINSNSFLSTLYFSQGDKLFDPQSKRTYGLGELINLIKQKDKQ